MKKISSVKIIGNLFLAFCCILAVGPIMLGILRSLFKDSMFTEFNHFRSYLTVITSDEILPAFLNTIFITLISVPLNIAIVALAAYGFSKFQFKGKNFFYLLLLSALMLPSATVMYPSFTIIRDLKLLNTVWGIILIEVAYGTTFNLLMLKNYFDGIPNELLEAAEIDGAGTLRILCSILLPVSKPAMFVIILWSFLGSWNDYLWPLLLFLDSSKKTVTLLPKYFTNTYVQQYDNIFAALFIIMIPIVILYCCLQKYFQQGVISGAVKA